MLIDSTQIVFDKAEVIGIELPRQRQILNVVNLVLRDECRQAPGSSHMQRT